MIEQELKYHRIIQNRLAEAYQEAESRHGN